LIAKSACTSHNHKKGPSLLQGILHLNNLNYLRFTQKNPLNRGNPCSIPLHAKK
jgi:hypothetical protein